MFAFPGSLAMDYRHHSTIRSPCVVADEDQDFLSRHVNLGWDADGSEWNYRDDYPDILDSDNDLLKLFSREHSFEINHNDVKNPRKSSLEKPVGFLMQVKPRAYVCESLKSSAWGKFISPEKRVCDSSSQAYLNKNTDSNKVSTEQTNKKSGQQLHSVVSGFRRSRSVNDVLQESNCEKESVFEQEHNQPLKQQRKEENSTCGIKRSTNRLHKQFSVYSQNFQLNTRFLSKSHYHISHWRPEKSRVKTKEALTNRKEPVKLKSMNEERLAFKESDKEKQNEIEVRRRFDTDKNRSWVWESESNPSNKLKIFGKANQKQQNCTNKFSKICSSTEFANKKAKLQKNVNEGRKITRPTRQLSEGATSTVSLPAISSHNTSSVTRQKIPHKLGHFPCISTDSLMQQYKKYHDEFIKQRNKNNNKK